eukprot:CAMPEP_0195322058 /NCGR_PEP_ID=MMETSP0708-20121125/7088_1 /TAXON_ID=33640 /ORGANISM="Asterionellopsis glacialis, Strain CCMP134" /LENGTH=316 /DNA_ID=CAMNT_0040388817 /DNA_START=12 /DNA_END=959 /DNA_ORIENTATION=+
MMSSFRRLASVLLIMVTCAASKAESNVLKVETKNVELSNGVVVETKTCKPKRSSNKPPVVFVHGSFHSSWCYAENFLPYFAQNGYEAFAISNRGTGDINAKNEEPCKVRLMEQVEDLDCFLEIISKKNARKRPFLCGHSMGGLVVMKYVEQYPESSNKVGGMALLCSFPPTGMNTMVARTMRRSLLDSWKLIKGMGMKKAVSDVSLCRNLFFACDETEEDITRYQIYLKRDIHTGLDMSDLKKQLPLQSDQNGKASFGNRVPKILVLGASNDFIVDEKGVSETANFLGVEPVMVDSPHDVMLGRKWQESADTIINW